MYSTNNISLHSGVIKDTGHVGCDGAWLEKSFPTQRLAFIFMGLSLMNLKPF
jgi:hypothetical protein